jgi:glyoxylase-like metal-dependent hydrolase (beta-lactamase superfamily II)
MAFWTGPYAGRPAFADICERDDVIELVRLNLDGRVSIIDGTVELCPGVSLHLVGGHTPGLQVGAVATSAGRVVLASDAAHYWANVNDDRPSASVTSLPDMYYAFDKLKELASSPDLIIPGHDPAVIDHFPPPSGSTRGRIVQLA